MAEWWKVAPVDEIAEGSVRLVEADDTPIAVVKHEGEIYAVSNICTHAEGELHQGEVDVDGELVCPLHGAHFDVRTGEALTPPAFEALDTYPVRITDGTVYVSDEPAE